MSKVDSNVLTFYPPDTRGVPEPRYGRGNLKIGMDAFTYSRLPGLTNEAALGSPRLSSGDYERGTCPGASKECLAICYAARPVSEDGIVARMWTNNSLTNLVPPIPAEAKFLRLHVGGDFTSHEYIHNWISRLIARPDVRAWAFTRSWRVPALVSALELLRALPNVQLFASMDESVTELPPDGWRRAWINGDEREHAGGMRSENHNSITFDGIPSYVCPEETGRRRDCLQCGYCLKGTRGDVTFLKH